MKLLSRHSLVQKEAEGMQHADAAITATPIAAVAQTSDSAAAKQNLNSAGEQSEEAPGQTLAVSFKPTSPEVLEVVITPNACWAPFLCNHQIKPRYSRTVAANRASQCYGT
jgi:hypothetical protein